MFTIKDSTKEIMNRIERISKNILNPNFDGKFSFVGEESTLFEKMKEFNVAGVSIGIINDFKTEWVKCFGVKNVITQEPLTLETLMEVGSTSKSFAALAALLLVEKGALELDEDVNIKLTPWKIPTTEFTEESPVTLRHLLSHRGGINAPDGGFKSEPDSVPTVLQILNGEKPSLSDPATVLFVPGTDFAYSNYGYVIVQQLLEDVTNKTFPEIINELIFQPLEMEDSSFEYPNKEGKKLMAAPHDKEGEPKETGLNPTAYAQGGLVTTAMDLTNFYIELMKAQTNKLDSRLNKDTVKLMLTTTSEFDPSKFFGMSGMGLGMFIMADEEHKYFTHPGTNWPGATCLPIFCPETGQGAVIITNGINGEMLQIAIINSIAREYGWSLWK